MKNRLSNFVNRINKAVDSVTKALENSGSGNNKQSNNGSIIDRLPVGENKKIQQATPTKQKVVSDPVPTVVEPPKIPEPPVEVRTVVYSMYVCPDCRKVFKVKGNDKTVKCSHCEGVHLRDLHIAEVDWKSYSKDQRDKTISDLLDEEEFEEAFEEVEEESFREPSRFFDENGQFIDIPVTVKPDYSTNIAKSTNDSTNLLFPDDKTEVSSGSFFAGFEDLESGNGIGFGNSTSSIPTRTYTAPTYSEKKTEKRSSGNKPIVALVVIVLMGVMSFVGMNILKMKQQYDELYADKEVNGVAESAYSEESPEDTYDYQVPEDNYEDNNNYLNENYTVEEPDYYEDEYEYEYDTSDSYYSNDNDYSDDYDAADDYGYEEDEDSSYISDATSWGAIIVNANNGKIHNADCHYLPDEENRIYFNSLQEAINAGYWDRCGKCHP